MYKPTRKHQQKRQKKRHKAGRNSGFSEIGLMKIFAFIQRGIRLNSKPNFMKRAAQAVKQALMK